MGGIKCDSNVTIWNAERRAVPLKRDDNNVTFGKPENKCNNYVTSTNCTFAFIV